ncbi:MAG: chemotaxis protein CheW [Nitrospiria bacterium]
MGTGMTEDSRTMVERGADRRLSPSDSGDRRRSTADRRHLNNRNYATFFLDDHYLGVEVEKVQEVFTARDMTRVPLSSPMIAGLINLRGQIITAIDLRKRLGFGSRSNDDRTMNLVVLTENGVVDLVVDRIGDVIGVYPDLFDYPPSTLDRRLEGVVEGVYKLDGKLLLALNTEALVDF